VRRSASSAAPSQHRPRRRSRRSAAGPASRARWRAAPRARSDVVKRSSTSRTGSGVHPGREVRRELPGGRRQPAPSRPDRDRGRPTNISIAFFGRGERGEGVQVALAPPHDGERVARTPPGSLRATPMRTVPGSTARRTPDLTGETLIFFDDDTPVKPGEQGEKDGVSLPCPREHAITLPGSSGCCPRKVLRMLSNAAFTAAGPAPGAPPPCATSGLPPPPPPSALAAPATSVPADRPDPAPGLVHRDDHDRPVSRGPISATTAGCGAWTLERTSRASLRMESASVPSGTWCATTRPRRCSPRPPAICPDAREKLRGLEPAELALGVAEPGHHVRDPLWQLLRAGLELVGELADEHALAGEEAERVDAHEGLDAAHAGADGRLAEELDQAELARPGHVGAAATARGSTRRPRRREPRWPYFCRTARGRPSSGASSIEVWYARTIRSSMRIRFTLVLDLAEHRHRHRPWSR